MIHLSFIVDCQGFSLTARVAIVAVWATPSAPHRIEQHTTLDAHGSGDAVVMRVGQGTQLTVPAEPFGHVGRILRIVTVFDHRVTGHVVNDDGAVE